MSFHKTCAWPGCDKPAWRYLNEDGVTLKSNLCAYHRTERVGGHSDRPKAGRTRALTPEQEVEVRRRMRAFESPKKLAKEFGVTAQHIRAIMKRA